MNITQTQRNAGTSFYKVPGLDAYMSVRTDSVYNIVLVTLGGRTRELPYRDFRVWLGKMLTHGWKRVDFCDCCNVCGTTHAWGGERLCGDCWDHEASFVF